MSTAPQQPQTALTDDHQELLELEETAQLFRAHTSPIFHHVLRRRLGLHDPQENRSSLDTCKLPSRSGENPPTEEEFISLLEYDIRENLDRGEERVQKALELVAQGEPGHARRLLTCRKKSVEARCPTMAGGCGETSFVPVHCDSRLCPVCQKRRMGQYIDQYRGVVEDWSDPALVTLTIENVTDAVRGKERLRDAFGRLRQRVIPARGEGWTWKRDGGEPQAEYWKQRLLQRGHHDLARRLQKRYVDEDRGIPFKEIVDGGLYAFDIVKKGDGTYNVHLHTVANIPYLPQRALSSVWEDLTGAPVVDVRRVHDDGGGLAEVIGYAVKPPQFDDVEEEVGMVTELKGSCMVQCFGSLYGETPSIAPCPKCPKCGTRPSWWEWGAFVDMEPDPITSDGGGKDPP